MTPLPPDPPPPGFDAARLIARLRGHRAELGLRFTAQGPDWVALEMDYDARLAADAQSGILASGPIISMMDMAATFSIWRRIERMAPCATLDLRIDYLRPAAVGRAVFGRCECYRVTRRVAFIRGQAHDGDASDPLAHVAGTFMFTDAA